MLHKALLLVLFAGLLQAQSLFTAATGTNCTALLRSSTAPVMVEITCTLAGSTVINAWQFNPRLLEGLGNGLVVSINGVTMLFKKTAVTDPMTYEAGVTDGTTTKIVASGTIPIP